MSPARTAARRGLPVLGRDMGPVGRVVRALAGAWLVMTGVRLLIEAPRLGAGDVVAAVGTVLAFAVLYTVLVRALGDRVLTRLNPWTATSLLLSPVLVLTLTTAAADIPRALLAGAFAYVGVSLLLVSVTGYGGCEIVGIPMALLRRRYTVYCPLNAVDAVERPFRRGAAQPTDLVAGGLALLAATYYLLLQGLLAMFGVDLPIDSRWGVVLLLPAIVILSRRSWPGVRETGWSRAAEVTRSHGVGALALTATAGALLASGEVFLASAVLLGVIYAGGVVAGARQLVRATGTRGSSRGSPRDAAPSPDN